MNRREALKTFFVSTALGATPVGSLAAEIPDNGASALQHDEVSFWLETSLKRVYPTSPPGSSRLRLLAARNGRVSFQACFRNLKRNSIKVECAIDNDAAWKVTVRRVGFVPLHNLNTYVPLEEVEGIGHLPGLCPDPLHHETVAHVGPMSNSVFWISIEVPETATPGLHNLRVKFTRTDEFSYTQWIAPKPWTVELLVDIDVRPLVIQKRKDFPVTQWISADSIWEYYKINPCGDRFWQLADAYIADLVQHHVNVIYTPLFNNRYEILKRPAQLLRVAKAGSDTYRFDFSDVRKWVQLALKNGAEYLEWTHFFTPAPTSGKYPQRIYERDQDHIGPLLWPIETRANSPTYRKFLEQFIPQFKRFLETEGVFEKSLFHCADEPDGPQQVADYRTARGILKELAPWMKVMDALSDPVFAREHLTDVPVPSIVTAPIFTAAKSPAWAYFCCGPRDRYLQRLLDTPLAKIRMAGWLFYRLGAKGFLHWGYNYWFVFCTDQIGNPFLDASCGSWPGEPAGDPFEVYPGADGPLDSIRWEVFAESLQDYALLQSAGIDPADALLASIKDYQDFPKTERWLEETRARILGAS